MAVASGSQASTETKKTCDKPGDETDKECKDLRAQQDMAKWARLMYFMSALGVVVSAIVAGFVVATFKQTRIAAKAAKDAVELARISSEKQLRAYVMVDAIKVIWPSRGELFPASGRGPGWYYLVVHVKVKNSGATPARRMTGWVLCDRVAEAATLIAPDRPQERHGVRVVGPGHESDFDFRQEVDPAKFTESVDALQKGTLTLYVWGKISYEDAFGHTRETLFRYAAPQDRIYENGAEVIACTQGNDYT